MKIEIQNIASNVSEKKGRSEELSFELGQIFKKKVGIRTRQRFYSDLHLLLNSGLDMRYSLQLLVQDETTDKRREKLRKIEDSVVGGTSLSDAVQTSFEVSDFEYYSLKIGEETGRVSEVLSQLAHYFDGRIQQRRQIISALSYPIIVLCTAIGAVVFMLQVVVPLFEDVFTRFGKDLPGLTKAVISASDVLGAYLPIMLMALVSIFLSYPLFRKKEWFSKLFAWVQQKVPLFGAIIVKMHLLRLVSSLELMLSSNTNLVKAIELSGKMSSFYPIKQSLSEAQKDITNGLQLSESLAKFKIYDSRFLTLIRVGEEVNQLPVTLSKLRIQYEKDIDVFSKTVGSLLEPAIILFIGAFVGTIIIAMYLPMFELSTLF